VLRVAGSGGLDGRAMDVAVVGLGYVGAVTAACLAELGHAVVGIDIDPLKVEQIEAGRSPIVEPRLDDLVSAGRSSGRLRVTTSLEDALVGRDVVVVCVGTPARSDGTVNLEHVERVSEELGRELAGADRFVAVIYRSTVPPGTVAGRLRSILERESGRTVDEDFGLAMVPEFLREGSGVEDFLNPPFTAAGVRDERTLEMISALIAGLGRPVFELSVEGAEALKYTCNAFHAVKITFANEVGRILSAIGVDARDVMRVFCRDDRLNISPAYLRPGFAFGGSCLPKDLRALMHVARLNDIDVPMLNGVLPSNESHLRLAVRRVLDVGAREIALLGLSFKPETDDLRESPFVELAETLVGKGARLRIFDPIINPQRLIGANRRYVESRLPHLSEVLVSSAEEALQDVSVVVVGAADADGVRAIVEARPSHVFDLQGGLGRDVEALPGYESIAW
jgi:GDP-mannose 6-dehydrogenase